MSAIWALAIKDLRLLLRDKTGFFFVFVFPLIFAVFFGAIFSRAGGGGGEPPRLDLVVVNLDDSPEAASLMDDLRQAPELRVREAGSRDEAVEHVLKGRVTAYLLIPKDYGREQAGLFMGTPATLEVGIDPARSMERGMLEGTLHKIAFSRLGRTMTDPAAMRSRIAATRAMLAVPGTPGVPSQFREFIDSLDRLMAEVECQQGEAPRGAAGVRERAEAAFMPVAIRVSEVRREQARRDVPMNYYAVSFPQGMMWGVMGCSMGFAASLLTERQRGTLSRLLVSPMARHAVLVGKAMACFLTTVAMFAFLLAVAVLVFRVEVLNPGLLVLAVVSVSVGFVGVMMLISTIARTEAAASGLGWGVLMVLAMLGGAAVPLFVMPAWVQTVSHISPMRWAIRALEGGIFRPFELSDMLMPCGVMLGLGIGGMAAGAMLFRYDEVRA
jgi:ABC-2 type transport system permease protein